MTATKDLEQKLGDMVAGFDALVTEMETLRHNNLALRKQLGLSAKPSTPASTENGEEHNRDMISSELGLSVSDGISLAKAREVASEWRKSHKSSPPPKIDLPEGHPQVEFEQDFTTPGGTQGQLGCPFAAMMAERGSEKNGSEIKMGRKGRRPGEPSLTASSRDPIAAEFHSNSAKSQTTTPSEQVPKCPIRFLDQHKPEEVAEYFQNHKHEIPRSHEICIKRYQSNEQSIRQLDAKYGSLVNMIQGLGKKHQPMLEEKEDEDEDEQNDDAISQAMSDKDIAKIQKWAGDVGPTPVVEPPLVQQLEKADAAEDSSSRQPRFERDLREIRLGESPSRPWGIRVPAEAEEKAEEKADVPSPSTTPEAPPRLKELKAADAGSSFPAAASMTFNGPVFFGYSADDMARLLQQVPELRSALK